MKKKRIYAAVVAALLSLAPLWAVFKERDLPKMLDVLHYELINAYNQLLQRSAGMEAFEKKQHQKLVKLIENCNELSLMLYSQKQDFTFDLTYALDEVTNQYLKFSADNKTPYNEIVNNLEIEIDRYDKLVMSLKNLPPAIKDKREIPSEEAELSTPEEEEPQEAEAPEEGGDTLLTIPPADSVMVNDSILMSLPSFMEEEEGISLLDPHAQAVRDSCLYYANQILDLYWESLFRIDEDYTYYQETDSHLREAYNYALSRYGQVQKNIFINGQTAYPIILRSLPRFVRHALGDCRDKYGTTSQKLSITSEWRGPMVLGFLGSILLVILLATALSTLLVRGLARRFRAFRENWYEGREFLMTVLAGLVIFALVIMTVDILSENNFVGMAMPLVAEFAWLAAAIFTSVLIRMSGKSAQYAIRGYLPVIVLCLVIITFRIIFIPNSLINLIFPPILLLVGLWQFFVNRKVTRKGPDGKRLLPASDRAYLWISLVIVVASAVVSIAGFVMIALLVVIWWTFQLTLLQTFTAISDLISRYYEGHIKARKRAYKKENFRLSFKTKGAYIEVSWLYDLCQMALVPILITWSIPMCVFMAGDVFDLSAVAMDYFDKSFLSIDKVIDLSMLKIILVVTMFFVFRYLNYAAKSFYRVWRTRAAASKIQDDSLFDESEINFTLADNIITLMTWGSYIVIIFIMLKIPATAITIVSTGLATGIGFAMKDVLNNFFYGMQLMSGRLRVGDIIECDGIRGAVDSMSYQSTQIAATDGSIIAFPNSSLFAKNFKNLTRNNAYEMVQVTVGIKYGSDVQRVRELILEALKKLCTRDKYGREIVDSKRGITVRLNNFGDSSVDLVVTQFVTVAERYQYAADAREIIYNTLNENGIEIPFPQRDVHIKDTPQA